MDVAMALATQLANIEKRTGRSLAQLAAIVKKSGLDKHGEIVAMLKRDLGMGHGDANTLVHYTKSGGASAPPAAAGDGLDAICAGPKAELRPIHDALMKEIARFGEFEIAPRKAYVSLRRKKQFATIGPATKTEVEVGLNSKSLKAGGKIVKLPPGGMCQYNARISSAAGADKALLAAIRQAYDEAG
ncbi:MAG: DUF4287 domain-containing protein [Gammaproteobacteria bacterium]